MSRRPLEKGGPYDLPWPVARTVFRGVVRPAFVAVRTGSSRLWEWRKGIRTEAVIDLETLGCQGEERFHYAPSGWRTLSRILPKHEVGRNDIFIDFGSGLGRVVYQAAANYPFKKVIGVEVSEQLQTVAQGNIDRNRSKLRAGEVELVTADATTLSVPDDVTVVYFANPFVGSVFARVVGNLLDSVDRRPRRIRIIYHNPVEHDFLLGTGRVRPVRELPGRRPTFEWSRSKSTFLYEVV